MTQASQTSVVRSFSQADFDHFARLSGDNNPIHTDPVFSTRARFGRTVAHGLLLCSVLRGLLEKLLPGGRIIEQSVMFPAPTFTNEPMRFAVTITNAASTDTKAGLDFELEVSRVADGIVTCQGHGRVTR